MDCYLHIGMGKTGTSTIQFFCRDNRQLLCDKGLLFSRFAGNARHTAVSWYAKNEANLPTTLSWVRSGNRDVSEFRRDFEKGLTKEVAESSSLDRFVLSDEALWSLGQQGIKRLQNLLTKAFERVFVVVYLRRQDEHALSRYQQTIKVGETHSLEEFLSKYITSGVYDYHARLERWTEVFGKKSIVVRVFDPKVFVNNSLVADFLDAVGIGDLTDAALMENAVWRNKSIDAKRVEFLRHLNHHLPMLQGGKVNKARGDIVDLLMKHSTNELLRMDSPILSDLMAQCAATNRKVAIEYLDRDDGSLFPAKPSHDLPWPRAQDALDVDSCMSIIAQLWQEKAVPGRAKPT